MPLPYHHFLKHLPTDREPFIFEPEYQPEMEVPMVAPIMPPTEPPEIIIDDVWDALLNKEVKQQLRDQHFGGVYIPGVLETYGTLKGIKDIYAKNDSGLGRGVAALSYFGRSMDKADDLFLGMIAEDGNILRVLQQIFREDRDYTGKELASRIWGVPEEEMQGLGWGATGLALDVATDVGIVGMSMGRIGRKLQNSPNINNQKAAEGLIKVGDALDWYDKAAARISINAAIPGVSLWGRKAMQQLNRIFGAVSGRPMVNKEFKTLAKQIGGASGDGGEILRHMYNKPLIGTTAAGAKYKTSLASESLKDLNIDQIMKLDGYESMRRYIDFQDAAKNWRLENRYIGDVYTQPKFRTSVEDIYKKKKDRTIKKITKEVEDKTKKQFDVIADNMANTNFDSQTFAYKDANEIADQFTDYTLNVKKRGIKFKNKEDLYEEFDNLIESAEVIDGIDSTIIKKHFDNYVENNFSKLESIDNTEDLAKGFKKYLKNDVFKLKSNQDKSDNVIKHIQEHIDEVKLENKGAAEFLEDLIYKHQDFTDSYYDFFELKESLAGYEGLYPDEVEELINIMNETFTKEMGENLYNIMGSNIDNSIIFHKIVDNSKDALNQIIKNLYHHRNLQGASFKLDANHVQKLSKDVTNYLGENKILEFIDGHQVKNMPIRRFFENRLKKSQYTKDFAKKSIPEQNKLLTKEFQNSMEVALNELHFGVPAPSSQIKKALNSLNPEKGIYNLKTYYGRNYTGSRDSVKIFNELLNDTALHDNILIANFPEMNVLKRHLEHIHDVFDSYTPPGNLLADHLRTLQKSNPQAFERTISRMTDRKAFAPSKKYLERKGIVLEKDKYGKLMKKTKDGKDLSKLQPDELKEFNRLKSTRDVDGALKYQKEQAEIIGRQIELARSERFDDMVDEIMSNALKKRKEGAKLVPMEEHLLNSSRNRESVKRHLQATYERLSKIEPDKLTTTQKKQLAKLTKEINKNNQLLRDLRNAKDALRRMNSDFIGDYKRINVSQTLKPDFANILELRAAEKGIMKVRGLSNKARLDMLKINDGTITDNLNYLKYDIPTLSRAGLNTDVPTLSMLEQEPLLLRLHYAKLGYDRSSIQMMENMHKLESPVIRKVRGNDIHINHGESLTEAFKRNIKEHVIKKAQVEGISKGQAPQTQRLEQTIDGILDGAIPHGEEMGKAAQQPPKDLAELIRQQKNKDYRDFSTLKKEFDNLSEKAKEIFKNDVQNLGSKKAREEAGNFVRHIDNNSQNIVTKDNFLRDFLMSGGKKYRNIASKSEAGVKRTNYYKALKRNVDELNKQMNLDGGIEIFIQPWKGQHIVGYRLNADKAKSTLKKLRRGYKKFDGTGLDDLNFSAYGKATKFKGDITKHHYYDAYKDYLDVYRHHYRELGIPIDENQLFIPHQPINDAALRRFKDIVPDNLGESYSEALRNILLENNEYGTFFTMPYGRNYMGTMEELNNLAGIKIYDDVNLAAIMKRSANDAALNSQTYRDFVDMAMNENFRLNTLGINNVDEMRRIFNDFDINPEYFSVVAPVRNEHGRILSLKRFNVANKEEALKAIDNKESFLVYTNAITAMDRVLKNQYDYMMLPLLKGLTTYFNTPMKSAMLTNPGWAIANLFDSYFKSTHLLTRQTGKKLPIIAKDFHGGVIDMNKAKNHISNLMDDFSKNIFPMTEAGQKAAKKGSKLSGMEEYILNEKKAQAFNEWLGGQLKRADGSVLPLKMQNKTAEEQAKILGDINEYLFFDTFSQSKSHLVKDILFEESMAKAARGKVPENLAHKIMYGTENSWGLFLNNPINKAMFKASGWVENITRKAQMHAYLKNANPKALEKIRKGDTSINTYQALADATQSMYATHFNYSDMTSALQKLKYVIPFPTFFIKNMGFWLEAMFSNPRSLKWALKVQDNFWQQEGAERDRAMGNYFPIDAKGRGAIPLNERNILKTTPQASMFSGVRTMNDPLNDLDNRMSPLLKMLFSPIRDEEKVKYRPINSNLYQPNIKRGDDEFSYLKYFFHELNPYSRNINAIMRNPAKMHDGDTRAADFAGSVLQPRF